LPLRFAICTRQPRWNANGHEKVSYGQHILA
jgi:hypothetical protein